jgi:mRNA interferase MazF
MRITKGDIFLANLDPTVGAEIRKSRPVIVVSNNISNEYSPLVTVVPLTSQGLDRIYPFEVLIETNELPKLSKAKANQIRTIDKRRLVKKYGRLDQKAYKQIEAALKVHLDL